MSGAHNELSALLAAGAGGAGSPVSLKQKQKDMQSDMLNQLLQLEKQDSEIKALLYRQNKAAADLDALFATPSGAAAVAAAAAGNATKSANNSSAAATIATGVPSPSTLSNSAAYYNALAQEKMQDYAAFFQQQHGKYGIPDPLSKTTLAANNMFMSPSALFKIQQESLSAMMMKPPKSTTPSSARTRESSASPALERLTPTKSISGVGGGSGNSNSNSGSKYNFSAVDLAISSVPSNTPSPAPSDGSSGSSHRRPSPDLSRLYGELAPPGALLGNALPKKRMEFASVADLAAPPPAKIPKNNVGDDVLNLSHD